jgi:hypothetical protein
MSLSLRYDDRYIGELTLDDQGNITGPQVLSPTDPKTQNNFKS